MRAVGGFFHGHAARRFVETLGGFLEGENGFGEAVLLLREVAAKAESKAIALDIQFVLGAFELLGGVKALAQ